MQKRMVDTQKGQSMVLIALLVVGMIAILGLIIDGGSDYIARRDSQNASDAGAFAGARAMTNRAGNGASDDLNIRTAIDNFALANHVSITGDVVAYYVGSDGAPLSSTQIGSNFGVPSNATGVLVTSTIGFQAFLISISGGGNTVTAKAKALVQSGPPTELDNLMPMTLQDPCSPYAIPPYCPPNTPFTFGTDYTLQGGVTGPGSFQWVSYDNETSNTDLCDYLSQSKSSGTWEIGDNVWGNTGVTFSSCVTGNMESWLAKATPADRYWTIPVYDRVIGTGNNLTYHIISFAIFEFDGYVKNGSNGYVTGKFVKGGKLGHVGTPGPCNNNPINVCAISLSE